MEWITVDKYHIKSDADYRISKCFSPGCAKYAAWSPEGVALLYTDDLSAAKRSCLDDLGEL